VENQAVPYDRRVWLEACAMKEHGWNVSVLSIKNKKAYKSYELLDGIEIYRHPTFNSPLGKLGFLIEYLVAIFWETILSFKIYIKKPFHVIHAANPPDTIFLIAWFFKLLKVKFIFDHHDLSPELYQAKFRKGKNWIYYCLLWLEKLSCKSSDIVITTNNSYNRIIIERHKIVSDKIFVVRNDPLLKIEELQIRSNKPDKYSLVYLGTINKQDGVSELLKAINLLIFKYNVKEVFCKIIGDGESIDELKEEAKQLNIDNHIEFTGYIYKREIIKKLLQEADVCIEPAPDNEVNRHSTFIKIMEYMAEGKPIVAFDLPETRFSAGEGAILTKPGDIEGFALNIKKLLEEEELRKELGRKGYERVSKELNWPNSVKNLLKAYQYLS
jgi:glycosyltransferase involved in cell wall biosynthesis